MDKMPYIRGDARCSRCGSKCNQHHELCYECYKDGVPEIRVEEAVSNYFSKFQGSGFSVERQYEIRIGTYTPRPDVVLFDIQGNLAAIAECKRGGIVDYGIEQLKSYLSATDTRFGIFANSTNPADWEFYENRRGHQFSPNIGPSEFEAGVVARIGKRAQLVDEIQALEARQRELKNSLRKLKDQGSERLARLNKQIHTLTQTKRKLHAACEQLKIETDLLGTRKSELKTEIDRLERKEQELRDSSEQCLETLFNDLKRKSSEPPPLSENNADRQKTRGQKKHGIVNRLKNLFSKENS